MELLSIDCLMCIFRLLSVPNLYNLYATGSSMAADRLRHAVTILDFFAAFETSVHVQRESRYARSPKFWHCFLNVSEIYMRESSPSIGFAIPEHILLTLQKLSIERSWRTSNKVAFSTPSYNNLDRSVKDIGNMPKLRSLHLDTFEMGGRLLSLQRMKTDGFPTNLTILRLCNFELNLRQHQPLPPQLQEFYLTGQLLLRHYSFRNDPLNNICRAADCDIIRDRDRFQFPNSLLIFDVKFTSDHWIESDATFMMQLCLCVPDSLQSFSVSDTEIDPRTYPAQRDFVHLLPPNLRHLRVFHEDYNYYLPLRLNHLPPMLETLHWCNQAYCGEKIDLPPTLRFISFGLGGFKRNMWPIVKFTNQNLRIANVCVDMWPKVINAAGHETDEFVEKNCIQSIDTISNPTYNYSLHSIPPNVTKMRIRGYGYSIYCGADEYNRLPDHILSLKLIYPQIIGTLPCGLRKLEITLNEKSPGFPNLRTICSENDSILPRTLTSLNIAEWQASYIDGFHVDLAQSCPNLKTLILIAPVAITGSIFLGIKSLPPLLRNLSLSGFLLNLGQVLSNLTVNVEVCYLNVHIAPFEERSLLRNIVPLHLGASSECGWSFILSSEYNRNATKFDLAYFTKQLAKNPHLNMANVSYKNTSILENITCFKVVPPEEAILPPAAPNRKLDGVLEYYKRRDVSERKRIIILEHSSKKKRGRSDGMVEDAESNDEPDAKRPKI